MTITKTRWGTHSGEDIWLFRLEGHGMTLQLSNLGCTIVSLRVSGRQIQRDIVLGYQSAEEYLSDPYYVGALIGRYAGRIAGASFAIGAETYPLFASEQSAGNHLHGGREGFNRKIFSAVNAFADAEKASVSFQYRSVHLEEGYPGNVDIQTTISLTRFNDVVITYDALCDRPTHLNMTHHCYYNLTGADDALQQRLCVDASHILEYGPHYIPTGRVQSMDKTRYDFSRPQQLTADFNDYFIFSGSHPRTELSDPSTGLTMMLQTTYPGVLLYTGDYLGAPFKKNQGVCLETQFYPNAPNEPSFPSTLLRPGEKYRHETIISMRNIR